MIIQCLNGQNVAHTLPKENTVFVEKGGHLLGPSYLTMAMTRAIDNIKIEELDYSEFHAHEFRAPSEAIIRRLTEKRLHSKIYEKTRQYILGVARHAQCYG